MVEYKHLLDAHEQGKTIQKFLVQTGAWIDVVSLNLSYPPDDYRIKEKADEYIPWTYMTAPLAGVSFMRKMDPSGFNVKERFICTSVNDEGYMHSNGNGLYTFQEMFDKYLHSKVGATQWLPCGLKI